MTTIHSTTTWGSPIAIRHAFLIHGLTSSHTWHRVTSSLAARGYLVIGPNLISHASRVSPDYHISTIANDLRPYPETRAYDLIIGHSLGGVTVLHLLPYLDRSHSIALMLIDLLLNIAPEVQDDCERETGGDSQNRPWDFLDRLDDMSDKWKVSVFVADPAILRMCPVQDFEPPHVRPVIVPGAGDWIQSEFPDVIVEEALKRAVELDAVA